MAATLDYMLENECVHWDGSQLGSHRRCYFESTAEDFSGIGIFEAEHFSTLTCCC